MGVKCLIPLGFSEISAWIQKRHPNPQHAQICPPGKERFANPPIQGRALSVQPGTNQYSLPLKI